MQRCYGCMKEYSKEYDVCPRCGYAAGTKPESKSHLVPGVMLAGRYTVGRAIGHGGFGITYIAWDNKIQKTVAVKEYFPNSFATRAEGEAQISCFNGKAEAFFELGKKKMLDEARSISRFSENGNIVDIFDFFEENNTAYIVMQYLMGKDLKQYLRENGGKLDPEKAVEIIIPVINALESMHGEHIIHRDVSPDNIFICDNGRVKLLDFGSARLAVEDSDKSLSVMIKRGYAPREQYASRSKQGPWTDVYAVCATLYRMITGVAPEESTERDDTPLKGFAEFGVVGYDSLQTAVFNGLAVNYADRTQSVSQLRQEIVSCADKKTDEPEQELTAPTEEKRKGKTNIKIIIVAVAVMALVVGVAFGIQAYRSSRSPDNSSVVAPATDSSTEATVEPTEEITTEQLEVEAQGEINSKITWTLYTNGLLLIDGTGTMPDNYDYYDEEISVAWEAYLEKAENVVIADGITYIGGNSFYGCSALSSVTIPKSVVSINSEAFYGCDGLSNITVDENNLFYTSDSNGVLFDKNKTELICYPDKNAATSYIIPDGVTTIGNYAFDNCSKLTSVTIPASVTTIGDYVFSNCTRLTSITIPDSVTTIGYEAFCNCTNLTSVTIPDSVTAIDDGAFNNCDSLASVTIPDSVTTIGYEVFCNCDSLTSVTIPDSVTSIGYGAFGNCESLKDIYYEGSIEQWEKLVDSDYTSYDDIDIHYNS